MTKSFFNLTRCLLFQPIDNGIGRALKLRMGRCLEEWLAEDHNLDDWSTPGKMTERDRRILLTKIVGSAWEKLCSEISFENVSKSTGALMTIDGSEDSCIHPQGTENYTFNDDDAGSDSVKSFDLYPAESTLSTMTEIQSGGNGRCTCAMPCRVMPSLRDFCFNVLV